MQRVSTAILPLESAAERTDGVKIALQVGEGKLADAVVEALGAGFAGRAERQKSRFDRNAIFLRGRALARRPHKTIVAPDFKEAHIALTVIQVPFDGAGHGNGAVRT